jgi:methyltransferase
VIPALAFVLVYLPMAAEARLSAIHERALRRAGALEPRGDVYRAMQVWYPAAFLVMLLEGVLRAVALDALVVSGAAIFLLAKLVKYWAIATLGDRWTFRVLVPPGSVRTVAGPYRRMRHPNYVAVAGELVGVALAMHARYSGPVATTAFVCLMLRRVSIEERALAGERE